jgi:hypothetical protein
MATLTDRRLAATRVKATALRTELAAWRAASEAGAPLEKHHSQVRRIAAAMDGLLDRIGDVAGPLALSRLRAREEQLLTAHTVWDFFRGKLAQRLDATFSDHLRVCDDLAWNCYAPARKQFLAAAPAAGPARRMKEPPLVFLNAGWSPFAMGRDEAFQVDRAAGGWLAQEDFRAVIDRLPVPLIGLPWYQVAHLPDVLVTAHEVGHVVEWDFGLRADLCSVIADIDLPADRSEAWTAWQPEVFADVYGCLACGPAFVGALLDFFAADPGRIATERRNAGAWGVYPPAWLRLSVLVEALRLLGFGEDADDLGTRWTDSYGTPTQNVEFVGDAGRIASALLGCTCTPLGVEMRAILPTFPPVDRAVATNISRGYDPGTEDTRVLLAASRRLWERDPDAYVAQGHDARIRALVHVPPGTRRASESAELPAQEQADRDDAAALFDALFPEP